MTDKGFKVLRAVVYLTYDDREIRHEDESIEACQSRTEAEDDIKRILSRERHGLEYKPYSIEVVDAEYVEESLPPRKGIWDRLDDPEIEIRREGWR